MYSYYIHIYVYTKTSKIFVPQESIFTVLGAILLHYKNMAKSIDGMERKYSIDNN